MRHYFFVLSVFFIPLFSFAQKALPTYTIEGHLRDSSTQKSVAFATIAIIDLKDTLITSTYSNERGDFKMEASLKAGYKLEISFVGYENITLPLNAAGEHRIIFNNILLKPGTKNLDAVTVTGRKRIVEVQPGKLVYNATNDLTNKGGTAADVLRKAPVLIVDAQGNVSMRGNSNLKILINGKYSGQMARNPADALNMMPADIIQSIEIITTPSAKYDAEGAAGVINIITKKGKKDINGALELAASNMEQAFNPRIGISRGKWNFSFHGHLHRLRRKEGSDYIRTQINNGTSTSVLRQVYEADNYAPHASSDLALSFTPDSTSEWNFGMNSRLGKWPENATLQTLNSQPDGTIIEEYNQINTSSDRYLSTDINLGYTKKFRKAGRELNLLGQYSPGRNKNPYTNFLYSKTNSPIYSESNRNKIINSEYTFQLDYIHAFTPQYSMETGVKVILRESKNKYDVFVSNNGTSAEMSDANRSDRFVYDQDVYAAYWMGKANLKNDWYAEAGFRFEQTEIKGELFKTPSVFTSSFNNFVPTGTISKKIDDDNTLALSYTQRLTRPFAWDLNPNANASDPKNIFVGNPALKPEIAHQAELVYGLNKGANFFLNTSLYARETNNSILEFVQVDANGISTISKQNLASNRTAGLNFSSSVFITQSWSVNGNINISYLKFKSQALQLLNDGWAGGINLNTTFRFPKNVSLQLFGNYDGREVILQGYNSNKYNYSAAARKEFPKKRITATLAVMNPFSNYLPSTVVINSNTFESSEFHRVYMRAVKLTLNWEFGNMFNKAAPAKKVSNTDVAAPPNG